MTRNKARDVFDLWFLMRRGVIPDLPLVDKKLKIYKLSFSIERFIASIDEKRKSWETDYGIRAIQDWVKVHAAIEVDSFVVLSYSLTRSNVHESRMFEAVWDDFPDNVIPVRSLADTAYSGEACLQVALSHGATPYHGIKKNARFFRHPETAYESMTNFAAHWPNRYAVLYGKRNRAESVFSAIVRLFGHRLRCRSKIGRMNEVQAKLSMYNICILAKNNVL